ncbi:MAG TPA: TetR/AcrR family transcriptional regulator, partial [Mycobacterium sp.]|nr:TetR/AcrR family transcriptional regulator [Mycobacterium sp.]
GQTIGGWLAGDVGLSADDLIDQLAAIVDVLTDPRRFRD